MASLSQLSARLIDLFGSPVTANPAKLLGNLGVSPNGNVLVGTSTDNGTDKLQVNGSTNLGGLVTINGAAATNRMTAYTTSGSARWKQGVSSTAESGSNAGSDWFVNRYSDAGAAIDTPLSITRSSGVVVVQDGLTINSDTGDGVGQLRMVGGSYGAFVRNDGASVYLMSTAAGNQYGTYNAFRPFYWNLSTGVVVINGDASGVTVGGPATFNSSINVAGSVTGSGVLSNNGQVTVQGWGGNTNAGVVYFGVPGNGHYLYYNASSYSLTGGILAISAPSSPLSLTNSNIGGSWTVGPDNSNNMICYTGSTGCYIANGATSWSANSDERLKNIKSTITNAVQDVESIRTVRYTWKNDDDHAEALGVEADSRVYVGVIAQDVQKVVPEAVTTGDSGYLAVAYTELIPLCMAAIKELSDELKAIKQELLDLKGKQ